MVGWRTSGCFYVFNIGAKMRSSCATWARENEQATTPTTTTSSYPTTLPSAESENITLCAIHCYGLLSVQRSSYLYKDFVTSMVVGK